jgi:hypothetical protein
MPGIDMAQFVSQQGGQFGFIVQFQQNSPGAGDAAAGKGIGIDIVGIDAMKVIGHMPAMGVARQPLAGSLDIALQGPVLGRPVIG